MAWERGKQGWELSNCCPQGWKHVLFSRERVILHQLLRLFFRHDFQDRRFGPYFHMTKRTIKIKLPSLKDAIVGLAFGWQSLSPVNSPRPNFRAPPLSDCFSCLFCFLFSFTFWPNLFKLTEMLLHLKTDELGFWWDKARGQCHWLHHWIVSTLNWNIATCANAENPLDHSNVNSAKLLQVALLCQSLTAIDCEFMLALKTSRMGMAVWLCIIALKNSKILDQRA